MNDGKLEWMAKGCIFLDYVDGMKVCTLWCAYDSKSSKIIISRNVIFDESAMLNQKESVNKASIDNNVSKQWSLMLKSQGECHKTL